MGITIYSSYVKTASIDVATKRYTALSPPPPPKLFREVKKNYLKYQGNGNYLFISKFRPMVKNYIAIQENIHILTKEYTKWVLDWVAFYAGKEMSRGVGINFLQ